ncbi:hypothetical protein VTN00DRAFT_2516 [Thermoascus crustaceus]|uniref:uncharacterized protein n=1 Tax=Thermoascus crustaceus TaxID=5088 RepID=UPI003742F191
MQFSIPYLPSLLCAVAVTVTAVPSPSSSSPLEARDDSCANPLLCCPELKTPLDPTVDPILEALGVNTTEVVGSIGLECKPYTDDCTTGPKCCTEAVLLGGTVALGC